MRKIIKTVKKELARHQDRILLARNHKYHNKEADQANEEDIPVYGLLQESLKALAAGTNDATTFSLNYTIRSIGDTYPALTQTYIESIQYDSLERRLQLIEFILGQEKMFASKQKLQDFYQRLERIAQNDPYKVEYKMYGWEEIHAVLKKHFTPEGDPEETLTKLIKMYQEGTTAGQRYTNEGLLQLHEYFKTYPSTLIDCLKSETMSWHDKVTLIDAIFDPFAEDAEGIKEHLRSFFFNLLDNKISVKTIQHGQALFGYLVQYIPVGTR